MYVIICCSPNDLKKFLFHTADLFQRNHAQLEIVKSVVPSPTNPPTAANSVCPAEACP